MTRRRTILGAPVLALALAACAEKPAKPPVDGAASGANPAQAAAQNAPAKKPEYKRPPIGMNDRGDVSSISLEKFFLLHESGKALVFDARPKFFYNLGHVPGAISLPKNNCDEQIASHEQKIKSALAEGKSIVVYCTSLTCPDARTVAMHIAGFGYSSTIFSGGWDAWKDAGMPVE
jgi:rhodanese-related sulfurtransferase